MTKPIELVLSKLEGVRTSGDTGRQWEACCPAHGDTAQSLAVAVTNTGTVLLQCFAGCEFPAIVGAMGLEPQELYVVPEPKDNGITVGRLAWLKRLPANWLTYCRVRPIAGCNEIEIPYLGTDGSELFARKRTGPRGSDTLQPKGVKLVPYGLWRLTEWAEAGERTLILVEGESDCWSLWYHGFPALGIPGAAALAALKIEHVSGYETVIVWAEPGKAGRKFIGCDIRESQIALAKRRLRTITPSLTEVGAA